MPGSAALDVVMVAERGTGRLLGAAAAGREGAAWRVNSVAPALAAGLTADELEAVDLGYTPATGPAWDPILIAAHRLSREAGRPLGAPSPTP
jgi:hypothetical protein